MRILAIATLSLALTACGTEQQADTEAPAGNDQSADASTPAPGETAGQAATATLRSADGESRGQATATEMGDGIQIRLAVAGMEPGTYAAHVHTTGRCDPPAFESAGGHWNPTDQQHGREDPQGPHKGDLPNVTVGADGSGTLDFAITGVTIAGGAMPLLDADGAAMMIHAKPDDYRSQPSGDAGDRIACGDFVHGG